MSQRRMKTVGKIKGVNIGRLMRDDKIEQGLANIAKFRTEQARGSEQKQVRWIPNSPEECKQYGITDRDFSTTPKGKHEGSPNWQYEPSKALMAIWDAFHLAGKLLVQPCQIIVGLWGKVGAFGAYRDSFQLYEKAASKHKHIHVCKDKTHNEHDDQPKAVGEAISVLLVPFYQKYLA